MSDFHDLLHTTLEAYKPRLIENIFRPNPILQIWAEQRRREEEEWWRNATRRQKLRRRLWRRWYHLRNRVVFKFLGLRDRLCGCTEEW